MKKPIRHVSYKYNRLHRPFTCSWSYAYKDGGPILRSERRKWRFVNGFAIFLTDSQHWFLFRRVGA